jgi:hypothetical protein
LKMGPIRCCKMPVKDYHSMLHNIPEERRSHQRHGRSLKSRMKTDHSRLKPQHSN